MKKIIQSINTRKGFTLIEVIVSLVIVAILGSLLVSFMGTGIARSSDPVKQVRDLNAASGCIEIISANYGTYMAGGRTSSDWTAFKNGIPASCSGIATTQPAVSSSFGVYSSNFETITVTATKDKQHIASHYTQR
jgi:prepilin-type N-terminal cleavage/methylation domain-containing protein